MGYLDETGLSTLVDCIKSYDFGTTSTADNGWYLYQQLLMGTIESVNDSTITSVGYHAFFGCNSLESVYLGACTSIGEYAFYACTSLKTVSLPVCTSIENGALEACSSLTSLILSGSTVATLNGGFEDTPIEDGNGYIYVPSNLLSSYQSASNWSTYADQIVAIGDNVDVIIYLSDL